MNCLLTFNGPGANLIYCTGGGDPILTCSDIYGNECGDWEGCIADQAGINGNFSADPLFCDWENGDFTVAEDSPCRPAGNTCGVQVGAFGAGCEGTSVDVMSWGTLKGKYR